MNTNEAIRWLKSLKSDIGGHFDYTGLWHYEQALLEIIRELEQREQQTNCGADMRGEE